jgi:hypothetical protein
MRRYAARATVPESTLRVEMNGLEAQADNAKACDLFWNRSPGSGQTDPRSPRTPLTQCSGRHLSPSDVGSGGSRALLPPPPQ